ncbi:flagellar protein FlgN [Oscillospiraceae bacterium WX1]
MKELSQIAETLLDGMAGSYDLLCQLQEIAAEKETCLTTGDIEGLRRVTEQEEELLQVLNHEEKERAKNAEALSQAVGVFDKNTRLKEIVEKIEDTALRSRLDKARERLVEAISVLTSRNDRLEALLQQQIGYTDFMLNLLIRPQKTTHTYDGQGSRQEESGSLGLLDFHV